MRLSQGRARWIVRSLQWNRTHCPSLDNFCTQVSYRFDVRHLQPPTMAISVPLCHLPPIVRSPQRWQRPWHHAAVLTCLVAVQRRDCRVEPLVAQSTSLPSLFHFGFLPLPFLFLLSFAFFFSLLFPLPCLSFLPQSIPTAVLTATTFTGGFGGEKILRGRPSAGQALASQGTCFQQSLAVGSRARGDL